jgi:hypothetical protein
MFVHAHKIILDMAFNCLLNRVTRRLEKFTQILLKKSSQNSCQAKISPSKLNLKVQNIYIFKPLLKPKNTCNKPYFKTGLLGKNVKHLLQQKVAQTVAISFSCLIFSKSHKWRPKVAQFVKNCRSGNLVTLLLNNI